MKKPEKKAAKKVAPKSSAAPVKKPSKDVAPDNKIAAETTSKPVEKTEIVTVPISPDKTFEENIEATAIANGGKKKGPVITPINAAPLVDTPPLTAAAIRKRLRADQAVYDTGLKVKVKWLASPFYKILFTNAEQFALDVDTYGTDLGVRKTEGGDKMSYTQTLKEVNAAITPGVAQIKSAIENKFGIPNSTSQFGRYGIVRKGKAWVFPQKASERKAALKLMLAAVTLDGIGGVNFGVTFWTKKQIDFLAAVGDTSGSSQEVSTDVAAKDASKAKVEKGLKALKLVIEGNNPDNYELILRSWGWLKENY